MPKPSPIFKKRSNPANAPRSFCEIWATLTAWSADHAEFLSIVKELEEKYAKRQSREQFIAAVYTGLGDRDKVFERLEKDLQNNEDIAGIRRSPQFEIIRDAPRCKDLLKRMNLPE